MLELPVDRHPHNFAVFAHCFTCTKNLAAVRNISRALANNGFGVLRFDFTGLGESEGDFADTNFSGNVADLVCAAQWLETHYKAPALLVGHSLGGAAVIFAAAGIESVNALAVIGAPSHPKHVQHLLKSDLEEIRSAGKALVSLSGREFTIKKQFLDDLEVRSLPKTVRKLRKSILILHSPQDDTVNIQNAEELYHAAHHPKSFISLDGADHLLTNKADSRYTGSVIAGWASRYIDLPEQTPVRTVHQVVASLSREDGFTTQMKVGNHYMTTDEPLGFGGNDFGPSPYELVSAGLSACTAMTIRMYARHKGWDVQNVEVHISHEKQHAEDCQDCENNTAGMDRFERAIKLSGDLDARQKERLLRIADKCPVHKTLHAGVKIQTRLI
ncbi:MAG: alpha/beta fold hydrolase [Sinomicrobium sp.]|nr:alpha/beta fold hydrolase [Sinomicrobium sp.]